MKKWEKYFEFEMDKHPNICDVRYKKGSQGTIRLGITEDEFEIGDCGIHDIDLVEPALKAIHEWTGKMLEEEK